MTRGFSLHLDLARVLAALAVLVSHFGYPQVTAQGLGWARELNIGSDAVVVFFVLSGLVISHTAHAKDRTLAQFAFARLTRLWSVALPAILLACALCVAGKLLSLEFYAGLDASALLAAAARSVAFVNYVWFSDVHLPSNNPYWSVTYEFWCYAGFGAAAFLRGRTRVYALAAIALIAGPRIWLLAPCWALGVVVRDLVCGPRLARIGSRAALGLLLAPLFAYVLLQAAQAPAALTALTTAALGGLDPNGVFGFSDEFLWNWLLAALTAAHFVGAAALAREGADWPKRVAAAVRWAAGRTFSLYLFHMPVMQFAIALPFYDPSRPLDAILLAAIILATSVGLAELTERRLGAQRRFASQVLARARILFAGLRDRARGFDGIAGQPRPPTP
jgi:peptidoglycan/LPS O-acetylase OafA/YrhL